MAAIVGIGLLDLARQSATAAATAKKPAQWKLVPLRAGKHPAGKDCLDVLELAHRDEGLMDAGEDLSGALDPDEPNVEWVVEDGRHAVPGKRFAPPDGALRERIRVKLVGGDAYLLRADRCLHRVTPIAHGARRVVLNLAYEVGEGTIYGNSADLLYALEDASEAA